MTPTDGRGSPPPRVATVLPTLKYQRLDLSADASVREIHRNLHKSAQSEVCRLINDVQAHLEKEFFAKDRRLDLPENMFRLKTARLHWLSTWGEFVQVSLHVFTEARQLKVVGITYLINPQGPGNGGGSPPKSPKPPQLGNSGPATNLGNMQKTKEHIMAWRDDDDGGRPDLGAELEHRAMTFDLEQNQACLFVSHRRRRSVRLDFIVELASSRAAKSPLVKQLWDHLEAPDASCFDKALANLLDSKSTFYTAREIALTATLHRGKITTTHAVAWIDCHVSGSPILIGTILGTDQNAGAALHRLAAPLIARAAAERAHAAGVSLVLSPDGLQSFFGLESSEPGGMAKLYATAGVRITPLKPAEGAQFGRYAHGAPFHVVWLNNRSVAQISADLAALEGTFASERRSQFLCADVADVRRQGETRLLPEVDYRIDPARVEITITPACVVNRP